jgi:hypothetical protein
MLVFGINNALPPSCRYSTCSGQKSALLDSSPIRICLAFGGRHSAIASALCRFVASSFLSVLGGFWGGFEGWLGICQQISLAYCHTPSATPASVRRDLRRTTYHLRPARAALQDLPLHPPSTLRYCCLPPTTQPPRHAPNSPLI